MIKVVVNPTKGPKHELHNLSLVERLHASTTDTVVNALFEEVKLRNIISEDEPMFKIGDRVTIVEDRRVALEFVVVQQPGVCLQQIDRNPD